MGKTRRREKNFNDVLDVVVSEDYPRNDKRKKSKNPRIYPPLEEYDSDENYGSFEKIGRRK